MKKFQYARIVFDYCKRRFFLFDYIKNNHTALDILLKTFIVDESDYPDCMYMFDNYSDEKKIYNIDDTMTLSFVFHPKCQQYITDTCLYFLKNYLVPLHFFLSDDFYPNPHIASTLFKVYPECLFDEKFAQFCDNTKYKAPYGIFIPPHKKELLCRFFYIADDICDCMHVTYEKYYNIVKKYKI
jgi:hypothetical protein